jgi:hypothetical protein
MAKSLRAAPTGAVASRMATRCASSRAIPRSLRSSDVVQGSTMSACRASGFHHGSWTITVSGRRQARASLFRSCW